MMETHGPLLSWGERPTACLFKESLQYWKIPEGGSLVSAPDGFEYNHQTDPFCFEKVEVNVHRFYLFLLATIP